MPVIPEVKTGTAGADVKITVFLWNTMTYFNQFPQLILCCGMWKTAFKKVTIFLIKMFSMHTIKIHKKLSSVFTWKVIQ